MRFFEDKNRTWHQLMGALNDLIDIRKLYLGQISAVILQNITEKLSDIEVLTAEQILDGSHSDKRAMYVHTTY